MEKDSIQFAAGTNGGLHVTNMPLTTELADTAAPGLVRNAVDEAVVRIRPMATPIDQISRLGHVRKVDSMVVDYYSVDTRKDAIKLTNVAAVADTADGNGCQTYTCDADDAGLLEVSESFAFSKSGGGLGTAYVVAKTDGKVHVVAPIADFPTTGTVKAVRMGRAATQLDVQSPQFSALPHKLTNYCQIFKMQVEQSTVMKLSHKEIGWDFTDQQEAAVYDMRLGMEKQFLFGHKMKLYDYNKREHVMLTQGIWEQAGKDIALDAGDFSGAALIDMLRQAFTENSGSRRKILVAGSELIAMINKLEATRVVGAADRVTAWGIDFSELCSKFGRLFVVFSDVFDSMGMAASGMVIDPEYIQKHVFIPLQAETIDLRGSGQRNTEAIVLTEASCLTLRYPDAHARVSIV